MAINLAFLTLDYPLRKSGSVSSTYNYNGVNQDLKTKFLNQPECRTEVANAGIEA